METDWKNWEPNMRATLVFVLRGEEVLLIHKKKDCPQFRTNQDAGALISIDPRDILHWHRIDHVQFT